MKTPATKERPEIEWDRQDCYERHDSGERHYNAMGESDDGRKWEGTWIEDSGQFSDMVDIEEIINDAYQWHGEPVKVRFGACTISENKDKPLMWYNYLACDPKQLDGYKRHVAALEITYKDQVFAISNLHGIGVHKLLNGGWPDKPHFSLPVEWFEENTLNPGPHYFDQQSFIKHEQLRDDWERKTHPEVYEKMAALKKLVIRP